MLLVFIGILIGAVPLLWSMYRARRQTERIEEEKQQVTQERQQVVDFMHHMVEALGEGLSPAELHQRVVHAAILCSGALSACLFERTEAGRVRTAAVEGLFPPHRPLDVTDRAKLATRARFIEQVLRAETFPDNEGIVGAVIQTGRGQLVADAAVDPRVVRHDDLALKVRSVIAVPLQFRDRFFGVLAVANSADGEPFTETDFSLMQSLAEQAALALHNAEFLHYQIEKKQLDLDLSLASGIQQMLLPRAFPQIAGLEVDARYTPAQKVGGDFYDLIPLDAQRLGVAVADVSGKGIPASLLMAICRTNLRQIAPRHISPAAALVELNRTLGAEVLRGMFITLVYAVIDAVQNDVVFARAGHELPLLCRRDATGVARSEFVGSEGMPVGMVPDELFAGVIADRRESFRPGDVFMLYTDGITEAPNPEQKEFAAPRLLDAVNALHTRPAAEINDGLIEIVARFTAGEPQRDDLTVVTLRRS
ncbi:SpoIIE family protein phosphatase [Horticoccus luteus]|uniref:SpoIIE family protein phosphatase n=1 Tax=Horticoccus luteus TaxID=2862869 RepID=A0A8F9TZP7_9BACT|nr:GAF domain-containing SpoIIE family protein phosphatase [Horticoccus luteus]QYM80718.1 SpoIIE family protein phosphatase [Horticoccus luteus]